MTRKITNSVFLILNNMQDTNSDYEPTTEDIRILREWLKKMPHLVQDRDDEFLAYFIKGKKGSIPKAKIVLEKFESYGMIYPEFIGDFDIFNPTTQKCLQEMKLIPLSKRLDDGTQVFVIRAEFADTESKKPHLLEIWKYWRMLFHVLVWENNQYTKLVTIFDWKNLRLGHAKEITPVILAKIMESTKCLPVRIAAVYNVNVPPALERIINVLKSVVSKKLADRFHFISSIETLHQSIPREILPKDYGGNEDDIKTIHSCWKKKVESYRDLLIQENIKQRKLDHLRPKGKDHVEQEMVGTFKAITVD